ncbi:MAG: hypothetical protein P8K08_21620 [Fuerstiella sp.]|nr:hypothetical protein [Fuerstiella sp.]
MASSNLISLLRLLDNDLSADTAIRLRQRLENESQFADQYRQLVRVVKAAATPEELLEHVDETDPFDVARFVEGNLSDAELSNFEQRCWASESLLREVVSAWKATQDVSLLETVAGSEARARAIVSGLADVPESTGLSTVKEAAGNSSSGTGSSHPVTTPAEVRLKESEVGDLPYLFVDPVPVVIKRSHRDSRLVAAAATAVLAALIAVFWYWQPVTQEFVQSDEDEIPRIESPQTKKPRDQRQEVVQDDSSELQMPNDSVRQSPQGSPPLNKPDTKIVEDTRPGMNPGLSPPLPVKDDSATMPLEEQAVLVVNWSKTDGVAAARSAQTDIWSGIQSRSASGLWTSNDRSQLLTLSYSRVSGELSGGATMIADANSLIEITAQNTDSPDIESTNDSLLTPLLTVHRGRLAIEGLKAGQRLLVQLVDRMLDVEATRDNTTIALERGVGETVLAAYRGSVRADDRGFTTRSWGRFSVSGEVTAFRPKEEESTEWYRPPRDPVFPAATVCAAFNTAADFAQVAVQFETSTDDTIGTIASQAALTCAVGAAQTIPTALAGRLAGSANEAHRNALIQWLVSRFRENAVVGEKDLRLICRIQKIDPATMAAMLGWFRAAMLSQPPTSAQLTELVRGLRDTSPLFTRQCAKTFLQQILNDPLSEYSAAAPGNRAVSSIIGKVRTWQQSNK